MERLDQHLFDPIDQSDINLNALSDISISYWQDVWHRLKKNKPAMCGFFVIMLFILLAIFGPMMSKYPFDKVNLMRINNLPGNGHWLGTDGLGRDIWAQVWMGARTSLFVGIIAALSQMVIGTLIGAVSGLAGGKVDMFIMRLVDILIAIPYLIWVSLFMLIFNAGVVSLLVVFALTGWKEIARLVRGEVLRLKEKEFIIASNSLGASIWWVIRKHFFPNILPMIIVSVTFGITSAIFSEAFLSYIGLGIQPPDTSWGSLVSAGVKQLREYPHILLPPAVLISLTMLSLQLIGDGLRDATDPKMRI
jgi:oligopeptide transport system permease protein